MRRRRTPVLSELNSHGSETRPDDTVIGFAGCEHVTNVGSSGVKPSACPICAKQDIVPEAQTDVAAVLDRIRRRKDLADLRLAEANERQIALSERKQKVEDDFLNARRAVHIVRLAEEKRRIEHELLEAKQTMVIETAVSRALQYVAGAE